MPITLIFKKPKPKYHSHPGSYAITYRGGRKIAIVSGNGEDSDPRQTAIRDLGPASKEEVINGRAQVILGGGKADREKLEEYAERARERAGAANPDPDGKIINQEFREHLDNIVRKNS